MKIGPGRILGLVGGILAIVGSFLAWASVCFMGICASVAGFDGFEGKLAFVFGLIGLILVIIPKRGLPIGGLIMGILVIIWPVKVMMEIIAPLEIGIGIWITIVGAILLIVGSGLALREGPKPEAYVPPPMEEPMMEPPMEEPPLE
ncbi:MAG: hypothetical protein JSV43_07985 [Methanobacteriota archaeon]|nr:MAG: hypothetical protein JSV43_07985 [Euryarchaeota archaeon]